MRGVNAADIALNQGRHDAVLFTLEQEHVTTSEIPDAQHQSLHRAPRGKVLGNYFLFPRLDKTDQRAPAWIYLPEQLCRGHAVGWCGSMRLSADTHELAKRGQAYNMLHHALIEYAKDNGYSRLAGWVLTEPAKHCNQRALNAHLKRGWQLSEFRSTHRVETSPGVFEKLGYTFVYYDLPRTEKTTQQIETIGRHIAAEVFNKTPFFEVCAGLSGTIMARTLAQWTLGAAGLAMVEVGLASLATLGGLLGIRLSSRRASSLSSNSYKATKRFKQTLTTVSYTHLRAHET